MFARLRTGHWLIIVGLLAAIWWYTGRTSPTAQRRTFKELIFTTDTAAITGFTVIPGAYKGLPEIKLTRRGDAWQVKMALDSAWADPAAVNMVLSTVHAMRPVRMAGGLGSVGRIYDMDDATVDRLILYTGSTSREIRVGKSTLGHESLTLVNTLEDTLIYAVPGTMGLQLDLAYSGWLPKYYVYGKPTNWKRLLFYLADGSSYAMERRNGAWYIGDMPLDTSKVEPYLRGLAKSRGHDAVDPRDTLVARPAFQLLVEDTTRAAPIVVVVSALQDRLIARSSLNPGSVMPFDQEKEVMRMFRPPGYFLPDSLQRKRPRS